MILRNQANKLAIDNPGCKKKIINSNDVSVTMLHLRETAFLSLHCSPFGNTIRRIVACVCENTKRIVDKQAFREFAMRRMSQVQGRSR